MIQKLIKAFIKKNEVADFDIESKKSSLNIIPFLRLLSEHLIIFELKNIQTENGFMLCSLVPEYIEFSDSSEFPMRSKLLLIENDRILPFSHCIHQEIRELGAGRYSHWNDVIYFSSLENSKPIANNKYYGLLPVKELEEIQEFANFFIWIIKKVYKNKKSYEIFDLILSKTFDSKFYFNDVLFKEKEIALNKLIPQLRDIYGGSFGIFSKFKYINYYLNKNNYTVKDKTILELGPGKSAGVGLISILSGAKKYYSIDAFKDPDWNSKIILENVIQLSEFILPENLSGKFNSIVEEISEDSIKFKKIFLEEIWSDFNQEKIPLPDESCDLIISLSVFEHINKPREIISENFRILNDEGICLHIIDLTEHKNLAPGEPPDNYKPLDFLKYSDEEWAEKWNLNNMHNYMNRWRKPDFISAFQESGFELIMVETEKKLPGFARNSSPIKEMFQAYNGISDFQIREFDKKFQAMSKDDLDCLILIVLARKKK